MVTVILFFLSSFGTIWAEESILVSKQFPVVPGSLNPDNGEDLLDLFDRSGSERVPESPVDDLDDLHEKLHENIVLGTKNRIDQLIEMNSLLKDSDCEPRKCQYIDEHGFTKKGFCSYKFLREEFYEVEDGGCNNGCRCLIPNGQKGYKLPIGVESVPLNGEFSLFIEDHQKALLSLERYFETAAASQPQNMAPFFQDIQPYLNRYLYQAAFSNYRMSRGHKNNPPICERVPEDFVSSQDLKILRDYTKKSKNGKKKRQVSQQSTVNIRPIPNGYTVTQNLDLSGTSQVPEHRVAYFREDHGMNSHHYQWHEMMYNINGVPRGDEYFIYMHSQMLKRYNIERMAVGLRPVVPYSNFNRPIEAGHRSNLGRTRWNYGLRYDNMTPARYQERTGIEASRELKAKLDNLIPNRNGNGNIRSFVEDLENYHNGGHMNIARTVLPGSTYNVMAYSRTSARDNVFYRWHQHIDDMYEKRRTNGAALITREMAFDGLKLLRVMTYSGRAYNQLFTGCGYHQMNISAGLAVDIDSNNVIIKMIHLDHKPFWYYIQYKNELRSSIAGVVRIFLAPKYDIYGRELDVEEQRKYWIEMDKFKENFKSGTNHIWRKSQESTVTVDCRSKVEESVNWIRGLGRDHKSCGCGWPHHLLMPRGTPQGMMFRLFVIVTQEENIQAWGPDDDRVSTYCGWPGKTLSDRREMGFPFHVAAPRSLNSWDKWHDDLGNVAMREISITFTGEPTNPKEEPVEGCGR